MTRRQQQRDQAREAILRKTGMSKPKTTGYLTTTGNYTISSNTNWTPAIQTTAGTGGNISWDSVTSYTPPSMKCAWCIKMSRNQRPPGLVVHTAVTLVEGTAVCETHADQLLTVIVEEE